MATNTHIEWTEATWNPVTGCTKTSPGCANCYAERMTRRLKAMGSHNYRKGFKVTTHPAMLDYPLGWRKPRMIFVNSMGDLFHENVPVSFIQRVFNVMESAHWHTYQALTKRAERLFDIAPELPWPDNVWMGVTVEDKEHLYRIDSLRATKAKVKFISFEPLLEQIGKVDLTGIDWAIVGGESGPGARPMQPEWARELRDQCIKAKVPFFFKQWGGFNKKKAGKILDGKIWMRMPETDITSPTNIAR
ncbi:phage Gp37/Gp68 family protein [candidate division TA06 bacterium]|uniref:Phage Gp37/Gp68 family protein n=1 Tax=candidate division TA06 bacterium TaxID=2250710 RepID=A0A933IE84_UNCT6|nr:phage Gp37/Gp68 family protein [candidate division TA06 bacterium]